MARLIRTTIDLDNPPPLSAKERQALERLAAMEDADIDTSDIPETDFSKATLFRESPFYFRLKRLVKPKTS